MGVLIKICALYREDSEEVITYHGILVLLALLGGLQQALLFKPFRISISMIIGCLWSIIYFTLITVYFVLCFAVFFRFMKAKSLYISYTFNEEILNVYHEVEDVSTWVTGGFDFNDDQDRNQKIG